MFDVNQIVLCCVCAENPMTKDQESIAPGNDYGRLNSLKPLNRTNRNACVPVRLYNIDLQIQANHSTNHSIAFPMNGPVECLKNCHVWMRSIVHRLHFLDHRMSG